MKIALLSYEYPPETGFGGIGTYTFYQARALARLGHDVHVFAGTDRPERRTYEHGNVTVTRFRKVGPVERLARSTTDRELWWFQNRLQNATNMFAAVRRAIADGGFDVVEMPECGAEGAWLNHCLDLPSVVRFHSPAELIMPTYATKQLDRSLTAMVERLGMTGARALTSCSHWLAREVRTRLNLDRAIDVIPNGIDLALFDKDEGIDIHEKFGIPREHTKIFFANRLEERKGIHVVRDIMPDILEQHPDAAFVLAGADSGGIVERELRPRLAERGVEDRLHYLGKLELPAVRACLKQSDVFLLPSIWENAPYSLLEAMSAGKAIVASDCGGVPEILRHEVDGLIARTGDAESFRRSTDRLLKNESLRRRFGGAARQRIEARFTDDIVARRSLSFYEWALGAPVAVRSAATTGPRIEVSGENWFQVWWMRDDSSRQTPVLARDAQSAPRFAGLTLDQIAFVLRVLERTYWERAGRSDTRETAFLDALAALHREAALRARSEGPRAPTERLALPALTHPVFDNDISAAPFVDELWRLHEATELHEWLLRELDTPSFVERATARVSLRQLAITAARVTPGSVAYEVLRQLYRTVGSHARVVHQDKEYIADSSKGAGFAEIIDEMGLHTALQRPPVFGRSRRSKKDKTVPGAAVTVLIPSYRHEAYIVEAMNSVLAQDHTDLRLLVVDDCSPDGTVKAARSVKDKRVEVRVNKENLGLGHSIDAVLDDIDTPYVALLNSDDLFPSRRLSQCLEQLEADSAAALVATGLDTMDSRGRRLTRDNSCIVDVGPNAHAWIRWYQQIHHALKGDDWTSLAQLLQHNHLATSSNIVARTDFLVAHRKDFRELKYCLDWMVFLIAALEEKLAYLPDSLLGYRLHDANTVWFDNAGRADYVHEVNRVVARTLELLAARRRQAHAPRQETFEELARLLRENVSQHGETDGFELFLAGLVGAPVEMPKADAAAQADRLALDALRRKQLERFLGDLEIRPWDLAQLHQQAARLQIDRHVADGFIGHVAKLAPRVGELETELATTRERVEDASALREQIDARAAERDSTADERDRIAAELDRVVAERDALDATRRNLEAQVAASQQKIDEQASYQKQIIADRDGIRERLEKTLEQRDWSESERVRLAEELREARRHLDQGSARIHNKHDEHRAEVRALTESYDYRLGRLLLRKLKLLGLFKTSLRLWTKLRVRGGRGIALLGRAVRGRAGKPSRAVFACAGPFPSAADGHLAAEILTLRGAGIDARILAWSRGPRSALSESAADAVRYRHVLGTDDTLFAADRRYFAKRSPAALDEIEASAGPAGQLATFARSAKAIGAAYLHCARLDHSAVEVWAASKLLQIPFGVSLTAADMPDLSLERSLAARILRDATLVTVDGPATTRGVRELAATPRDVLLKPPMVHRNGSVAETAAGSGCLVACIGASVPVACMTALADAVHGAVDRGADVRVELLTPAAMHSADVEAYESLVRRAREHGVEGRISISGSTEPARVEALLGRASALLSLDGCGGHGEPGLSVPLTGAMASGLAIIGLRGPLDGVVRDRVEGLLVEACDAAGLAAALAEIAADASLRLSLGHAARGRFDAELAPTVAGAAFCQRVQQLLDAE